MRKKRERLAASLARRRQVREPYDLALIVCEGAKTEPQYLNQLRNTLRLSHVNIQIFGKECGSSPMSVVNYALKEFKQNPDYDRIFCVFDKDCHIQYQDAITKVEAQNLCGARIEAITSVPCFEFWLLLHFEDTARPYDKSGRKSACDNVIHDLRKHILAYHKGNNTAFEQTYPYIDRAKIRAERLEERQKDTGTDNPSSKVYQLVAYLQKLKA